MKANSLFLVFWICLIAFPCEKIAAETLVSNGVVYRSITEVAERLGMKHETSDNGRTTRLSSQWSTVEFTRGSRIFRINKIQLYLGFPTLEQAGILYLPELDWQFTLSAVLIPPRLSAHQQNIRTIVIDPGHGGRDPGAQNLKLALDEKDLALNVAKHLAKYLKKAGYRVVLTRKSDTYLPLAERSAIARRSKADLFFSIHFNASTHDAANGIETFAYTLLNQPSTGRSVTEASDKIFRRANRHDTLNTLLAYLTQRNLIHATDQVDRGVKRARFVVLEDLPCPGVLVELGFLRHPQTAANVQNDGYLDRLAAALAQTVKDYNLRIRTP